MRLATCTPVSFEANKSFWSRDSGLICNAMINAGYDCKTIMPEPWHSNDLREYLIRVPYYKLETSEWWKTLNIDVLILYTWGAAKYAKIARAAKEAGIKIYVNMDCDGLISERLFPLHFLKTIYSKHNETIEYSRIFNLKNKVNFYIHCYSRLVLSLAKFFARYFLHRIVEKGRIQHLECADAIGVVSPYAYEKIDEWANYYNCNVHDKLNVISHPVNPILEYNTRYSKCDYIMAVGRWDDFYQKRPHKLIKVVEEIINRRENTEVFIFGAITDELSSWYNNLKSDNKHRIHFKGRVPNHELVEFYCKSRIVFNTSLFEGSHIASEEALCCGATIVAPDLDALGCMKWYVSSGYGQIAKDTVHKLVDALCEELIAWDNNLRDPSAISNYWKGKLSADAVVEQIIESLALK